ncbi:hypothetical protein PG984_001746 [Apiospora sp. TS-2023a]
MDLVTLNCKKCKAALGTVVNAWVKIGQTYISPVVVPNTNQGLDVVGISPIRNGEPTTLVDQCNLQDVACRHCTVVVGLWCLGTPAVNHVLQMDQLMLRLASISICTADTGSQVEPHIQRTLNLKEPVRRNNCNVPNNCPPGFREPCQGNSAGDDGTRACRESWITLRNDLDARGREIHMLGIAGHQLASSFNEAVVRIDSDIATLKADLGTLWERLDNRSRDLSGLLTDVSSLRDEVKENQQATGDIPDIAALKEQLESTVSIISAVQEDFDNRLNHAKEIMFQEMDSVRGELTRAQEGLQDLRRQLGDHGSLSRENSLAEDSCAKEVHLLRMEVAQLRNVTARDYARSQTSHCNTSPREELDILISNVAKFGNRVSQVETLQMESQMLKSRVQRLEANAAPSEGGAL